MLGVSAAVTGVATLFSIVVRPVAAQEAKPIYFGTPTKSVAWFPLYVAMKRGFLRNEGRNLQPVVMDSRVIVPSMASKEIPYYTGLGSAMSGAPKGLPLKVVMILGGKTLLVPVMRPEITSLKELKGKTIGVTTSRQRIHRILGPVVKSVGMDPRDVKVLGAGDSAQSCQAAQSDDRIRERPDEIKKIIGAILGGVAYTKGRGQEVLPLLQEFVGLENLEVAGKAYDVVEDLWPSDGSVTDQGLIEK